MTYIGVVQRRVNSIKTVLNYWQKGDLLAAINALNMMNDLSVVMDVLNTTFAEGHSVEKLTHDQIAAVLPLASNLTNSKFEQHILAGMKCCLNILVAHGQALITLKNAQVGRGVDLAREERLRKADTCIERFVQFGRSKGFMKALKNKGEVLDIANALQNHLKLFMIKSAPSR